MTHDISEETTGADATLKVIGSNGTGVVGGLVSPQDNQFTGKYHIFKICFVNVLKLHQYVPPSHFNFKTIPQAK